MRTISWWLVGSLGLLALGCSGGGQTPLAPTNPQTLPQENPLPTTAPPQSANASLGTAYQHGAIFESALAIYTFDIDPAELTATVSLKETRQAQANDDLYLLSIDNFLRADSLRITTVARSGSDLELGYQIGHPFPAPNNPTGAPNGFSNRSDLGIAGMVLFLADVSSPAGNTYFTDRIANTELISNADGYYSPEDMLSISGTANTFPYRQLVDESIDPRIGVSNGGNMKGNFGTDGWTRAKYGANNDGWTGYGVLHQGQTAANTVAFDLAALGGGFSLDVAVIAKYNDPRGGATAAQKRANRLPGATADHTQFAYRMPHGALDVASISFVGDNGPGFLDTGISGTELEIHVVDWDANGNVSSEASGSLELDPAVTNIDSAEAGSPVVEVCIPDVLGDATVTAAVAEDGASGEGIPGDPLIYRDTVTKTAASAVGTFTGMIRATDPEDGAPLYIALDQGSPPLPLPGSATQPRPVAYQAFTVDVASANTAPTGNVSYTGSDPLLSGTQPTYSVTGIADAENNALNIYVDWDDGNGFVLAAGPLNFPYANQNLTGPQRNNATLTPAVINVSVRLSDGALDTDYPSPYNLGPNRPPQVTGTRSLASATLPTPAIFTMNAGSGTATDPENDTISYTIVNNRNANVMTFAAFPNAANSTAISNPPHATVDFTVYANDALHPTTGGTAYPVVTGNISPPAPGTFGWVYTPLVSTTGSEHLLSLTVDSANNIYALGNRATTTGALDFGGGPRPIVSTGAQAWLVKLDQDGVYQWDRVWGSNNATGRPIAVDTDASNNVYVHGSYNATLVINGLGGGAVDMLATGSTTLEEAYLLKFNSAGGFMAQYTSVIPDTVNFGGSLVSSGMAWTSTGYGPGSRAMTVNKADGSVYVTGSPFNVGTADFGAGVSFPTLGVRDAVLVKFNSSLIPVWGVNLAAAGGGANNQYGIAVAVNPVTGNPYVGGTFVTSIDLGGGLTPVVGGQDAFIVARDALTGAYVPGSQRIIASNSTGNELITGLACDATHLYVTGQYAGAAAQTLTIGAPLPPMVATGASEGFGGAFTHVNVPVWQRNFTGVGSIEQLTNVVTQGGNAYFFGHFASSVADFGYGPIGATTNIWADPLMLKYAALDGSLTGYQRKWSAGPSIDEFGTGMTITSNGFPVMGGRWGATASNMNFDPGGSPAGAKTSVGGGDLYVVKINGATGNF